MFQGIPPAWLQDWLQKIAPRIGGLVRFCDALWGLQLSKKPRAIHGDLRIRWLGRQVEVRLRVHLSSTMSFVEAHDLGHQIQRAVLDAIPDAREVDVGVIPDVEDIPVGFRTNPVLGPRVSPGRVG